MKPEQIEELNNIRRMAERGITLSSSPPMESNYIDMFQHILDKTNLLLKGNK